MKEILFIENIVLTLSANNVADHGWSLLSWIFFSPVTISKIKKPNLYMSVFVETTPLCKYSGAMYPLKHISTFEALPNRENCAKFYMNINRVA